MLLSWDLRLKLVAKQQFSSIYHLLTAPIKLVAQQCSTSCYHFPTPSLSMLACLAHQHSCNKILFLTQSTCALSKLPSQDFNPSFTTWGRTRGLGGALVLNPRSCAATSLMSHSRRGRRLRPRGPSASIIKGGTFPGLLSVRPSMMDNCCCLVSPAFLRFTLVGFVSFAWGGILTPSRLVCSESLQSSGGDRGFKVI